MANNCTTATVIACPEPYEIILGATRKPVITLEVDDAPFDLSNMNAGNGDEIKFIMVKDDGTNMELLWNDGAGDVAIISAAGGKIKPTISATNSALLKPGEKVDAEIEVQYDNEIFIWQLKQGFSVVERVAE